MNSYLTPLISLVLLLLGITITGVINGKNKFALTEKEALSNVKYVILVTVFWLIEAYCIFKLAWFFISDEPITKGNLFSVLINGWNLTMIAVLYAMNSFWKVFKESLDVMKSHFEMTAKHTVQIEEITKVLEILASKQADIKLVEDSKDNNAKSKRKLP